MVRFIRRPDALPDPPVNSRIACVDIAFAAGDGFSRVTAPFLRKLEDGLAVWVDHHDHPEWPRYARDPRFVLVSKLDARACPQLIDAAVVKRAGAFDEVWAHADFDGCVAAAKLVRGGESPYPEADEDARFADAPGRGYRCSERGRRYMSALDQAQIEGVHYDELLDALCRALTDGGQESSALAARIDAYGERLEEHRRALRPVIARAERPHKDLAILAVGRMSGPDKKFLLRELEAEARVALIHGEGWSTIATFDDETLDLSALPGLRGQRGYAFGQVPPSTFLTALLRLLGAP